MFEITIAIMSVFAVWGLMDLLAEICNRLTDTIPSGKITIYAECEDKALEGTVRFLRRKNPTAEIIAIDTGGECRAIAEKLSVKIK